MAVRGVPAGFSLGLRRRRCGLDVGTGGGFAAVTVDVRQLPAIARQAGIDLEGASALDVLRWADQTFGSAWCVASSMADAVLPHLASRVRPGVDVIFLDTGYHFPETIGT